MSTETPRRSSRLWFPLLVLIAATAAAVAVKYWPTAWDRGMRNWTIIALGLLSVVLLAFWLMFLSRWPAAVRLTPVALLVLGSVGFALCVREVHFTGDMVPIFTFRWDPYPDDLLDQDREQQANVNLLPPEQRVVAKAIASNSRFESFFGCQRQGRVLGVELNDHWDSDQPRKVWRWRSGGGFAGFVVADGRAVTIDQRRDDEVVAAYDVDTGKELWRYRYPALFKGPQGGNGPRATPTLVAFGGTPREPKDYKVFALGASGHLACLDLESGEKVWTANILDNNANLTWGMCGSPLVLKDRVIVSPGVQTDTANGRGVIAYDMKTGKEVWATGTREGAYSSPLHATLGKREQVLVFDGEGLTGYDADNGKELWHFPWETPPKRINVAQPLILDEDRVFISSGYGRGCAMLQVTETNGKWTVKRLWKNALMCCKFTSPVHRDGYLYGLNDGILTCLSAKDGSSPWPPSSGREYGHGQLLLADRHLLILSDEGDLALVEATPERFHEIGKKHVLDGKKTWNPPALAGNYAFVRNETWMACYELPGEITYPSMTSSIPSD